jgi:hypothetical protein
MDPQPVPEDAHAVVAVSCYPTVGQQDGEPQPQVAVKINSVPMFHVALPEFVESSAAYFVLPAGGVQPLVDALLDAHDRAVLAADDAGTVRSA